LDLLDFFGACAILKKGGKKREGGREGGREEMRDAKAYIYKREGTR